MSLDNLIPKKDVVNNNIIFTISLDHLHVNDEPSPNRGNILSHYYENMRIINTRLSEFIKDKKNSTIKLAYNFIPSAFYLEYPELKHFMMFQWMYQYDKSFLFNSISQLKIKEDTIALNSLRQAVLHNFKNSEYVLDRHIFQSMVDDILYFVRIGLITPNELTAL
ncbi:MAG: hypothetical protein LBS52_08755, partial [Dysgonamonadaceae bacterium]|nr:hypothetical protein [Dysgonamonadaceae bacterium]